MYHLVHEIILSSVIDNVGNQFSIKRHDFKNIMNNKYGENNNNRPHYYYYFI